MKRSRIELVRLAKSNLKKIEVLQKENIKLIRESYLLCDKKQYFTEEQVVLGRGKTKRTEFHGRIHWKETFVYEDTKKKFKIERSRLVRINNEWI